MYHRERRDMRLALDGASCGGGSLDLTLVVMVCDVPDFEIPGRNIARATSMMGAERVEEG